MSWDAGRHAWEEGPGRARGPSSVWVTFSVAVSGDGGAWERGTSVESASCGGRASQHLEAEAESVSEMLRGLPGEFRQEDRDQGSSGKHDARKRAGVTGTRAARLHDRLLHLPMAAAGSLQGRCPSRAPALSWSPCCRPAARAGGGGRPSTAHEPSPRPPSSPTHGLAPGSRLPQTRQSFGLLRVKLLVSLSLEPRSSDGKILPSPSRESQNKKAADW